MSSVALTSMGVVGDLEQAIHNLEFENQQYVKEIAKEEIQIASLENQVSDCCEETSRIQQNNSQLDEDAKRYHKQFKHNRDTCDSLRKTISVISSHIEVLVKKFSQLQEDGKRQCVEWEAVLDHYRKMWQEYNETYESFEMTQILRQKQQQAQLIKEKNQEIEAKVQDIREKLLHLEAPVDQHAFVPYKTLSEFIIKMAEIKMSTQGMERNINNCEIERLKLAQEEHAVQEQIKQLTIAAEEKARAEEEKRRLEIEETKRKEQEILAAKKLEEEARKKAEEEKWVQEQQQLEQQKLQQADSNNEPNRTSGTVPYLNMPLKRSSVNQPLLRHVQESTLQNKLQTTTQATKSKTRTAFFSMPQLYKHKLGASEPVTPRLSMPLTVTTDSPRQASRVSSNIGKSDVQPFAALSSIYKFMPTQSPVQTSHVVSESSSHVASGQLGESPQIPLTEAINNFSLSQAAAVQSPMLLPKTPSRPASDMSPARTPVMCPVSPFDINKHKAQLKKLIASPESPVLTAHMYAAKHMYDPNQSTSQEDQSLTDNPFIKLFMGAGGDGPTPVSSTEQPVSGQSTPLTGINTEMSRINLQQQAAPVASSTLSMPFPSQMQVQEDTSPTQNLPVSTPLSPGEIMSPPKTVPRQAGQSPAFSATTSLGTASTFGGSAENNNKKSPVFSFAGEYANNYARNETSPGKGKEVSSFESNSDRFSFGMAGDGDSAQPSAGFSFGGFGGFGASSDDNQGGSSRGILSMFGGGDEEENSSSSAGTQDTNMFSFSFGGGGSSSPDVPKSFSLFG